MSAKQYAALPAYLLVREVRVLVQQQGFRTQRFVVVTTLLDAEQHAAEEIAQLYRRRWQAELHLRSLKSVLQMDHLRCKTPHRVRNEFYMHLIMYNLLRGVVALAAFSAGKEPWRVSFKGRAARRKFMTALLFDRMRIRGEGLIQFSTSESSTVMKEALA